MSQGSIEPSGAGVSGSSFALAVRVALKAITTGFAGNSAPTGGGQPFELQTWIDTALGFVKRRHSGGGVWVTEGKIDGLMADGICRSLWLQVLNTDLTQVIIDRGAITVEGTYLPPLASQTIDTNNSAGSVGALDTGAWAANTWYAVWCICNEDGSGRGYIASLSFSAPSMPGGYTRKRLIGAIRTTGTATNLQKFRQIGNRVLWHRDIQDADLRVVNTASPSATYSTVTCTASVPPMPGVLRALGLARIAGNGSLAAEAAVVVAPTGQGLTAPNGYRTAVVATANAVDRCPFEIDLNGSRQFEHAVTTTTNVAAEDISIIGWEMQVAP